MPFCGLAQDIPVGTWQSHLSYRDIVDIEQVGDRIYAQTTGGLFYYQRDDNSIVGLSSVDGLRRAGITAIEALNDNYLIIGYDGGEIDLLSENEIVSIDDIVNSSFQNADKIINDISTGSSSFLVSTDFGVVRFNSQTFNAIETYWQLDNDGDQLRAYSAEIVNDLVVVATEKGLMSGSTNDNLLDFNNWDRQFGIGISRFTGTLNDKIYAGIGLDGLFEFNAGSWVEVDLDGEDFRSINEGQGVLWVCTTSECLEWTPSSSTVVNFQDGGIQNIAFSTSTDSWLGTSLGLYMINPGPQSVLPSGPFEVNSWSLDYVGQKIIGLSGSHDLLFNGSGNEGSMDVFGDTGWENFDAQSVTSLNSFIDPVDVTYDRSSNTWLISSYDQAIISYDGMEDFQNLSTPPSLGGQVSSLYWDSQGLWVVDTQGSPAFYHRDNTGTWNSFSIPSTPPLNIREITSDNVFVYMLTDPIIEGGIIMFEKSSGLTRVLNTQQNAGDFPGTPTAMVVDRNGRLWVGTTNGVAFITAPSITGPINALTPINEFTPLLRGQRINAIAIDGGNRKWIATNDGVWLMDDRGEEVVSQFDTDNSPLLSDEVTDIAVDDESGEVFFLTSNGVISYRGDGTEPSTDMNSVRIFPNPVRPGYTGVVAFSGLVADSNVKITDTAGNLIWETFSNGGSASWNLIDHNGKRPSSGIYFVFLSDEQGNETFVGKLAIIR